MKTRYLSILSCLIVTIAGFTANANAEVSAIATAINDATTQAATANAANQVVNPLFNGKYERRKVAGVYDGKMIAHPDADLYITGTSGTFKMESSERCFNKEVPVEVSENIKNILTVRLKFSAISKDCKEFDINFYLIVRDGKVGLARVNSTIFEFEKIKQPSKKPVENKVSTTSPLDGKYETRNFSIGRDSKFITLQDADLYITGTSGTYKHINATGKCFISAWPIEIIKSTETKIQLIAKGTSISHECKDYTITLNLIREDGETGLAFDNSTKIAFRRVSL